MAAEFASHAKRRQESACPSNLACPARAERSACPPGKGEGRAIELMVTGYFLFRRIKRARHHQRHLQRDGFMENV